MLQLNLNLNHYRASVARFILLAVGIVLFLVPANAVALQSEFYPAPVVENSPQHHQQPRRVEVGPISAIADKVSVKDDGGLVTVISRDAELVDVLNVMADQYNLSFVFSSDIQQRISISLRRVPLEDALSAVLGAGGYTWTNQRGIIQISPISLRGNAAPVSPEASGRIVRVFPLDYVSAEDVNLAITQMLSEVGQSQVITSDTNDHLKSREVIVVEDLPGSVARVEQYIREIDQAPRQVMIDVHVLEVDLDDNLEHGVDFQDLINITGGEINLGTLGVTPTGTGTFFAQLTGTRLNALLVALQTQLDSKTLASTRIMALNGQEARLQVGQQLGFRVLTTTQTATLEEIRFLDVGVVVRVTPRISRDGRIMLAVRPEVSSGQINPTTGLPEEETSEVETDVMLSDGKGMIIGGLIQEQDVSTVRQIPKLGDIPKIGKLFRRETKQRQRSEVIFFLLPRIVDSETEPNQIEADRQWYAENERNDALRASQSILDRNLNRVYREMDPRAEELHQRHSDQLNSDTWSGVNGSQHAVFDSFSDLRYQGHGKEHSAPRGLSPYQPPAYEPSPYQAVPQRRVPAYQQPNVGHARPGTVKIGAQGGSGAVRQSGYYTPARR